MLKNFGLWMLIASCGWAGWLGTGAAQSFPVKPVRLLVPFAPGGGTDLMARALQDPVAQLLGQPLIVENKPGAGGSVAAREVARSTPDGHTLVFVNNGYLIAPLLQKDAGYDPVRDFEPVALISVAPLLLVTHSSVPARDVEGLLAYARAQSAGIEYGSAGIGTLGHIATELFARSADIKVVHVPYKGSAPAANAVIAGEVKFTLTAASTAMLGQVKAGRLRLLGVSSPEESPVAPGIPPIAKTVKGFSSELWYAILAPAGTPPHVADTLAKVLNRALAAQEIRQKFLSFGVEARTGTGDDLKRRITGDLATLTRVVREADIRPE